MLNRSEYVHGAGSDFGVPVSEIKYACDIGTTMLSEYIGILDRLGVIMEGDPDDFNGNEGFVFRKTPSGWLVVEDLKEFTKKSDVTLTQLLVELRFDLMD